MPAPGLFSMGYNANSSGTEPLQQCHAGLIDYDRTNSGMFDIKYDDTTFKHFNDCQLMDFDPVKSEVAGWTASNNGLGYTDTDTAISAVKCDDILAYVTENLN